MMHAVSLPLRRALALSVLLAILALGWVLIVEPLVALSRDRADDIAALSDELAHLRAARARQPDLERRATSERAAFAAEGGQWTGASAAEVAAAMQDRLRQVIGASHGRLRSTAVASEADEHGLHRVTVHFNIEGIQQTVQATLAAVEASRPAMFVESAAIRATGGGGADAPPALTMDLEASGYMAVAGS